MDLSIIPECNIDTNLIETLVPPLTRYNHQKGCGTVAKTMKEEFRDRFAVGIIDKDKIFLDYLNEFDEVTKKGSLELYKHRQKHHYFIRISPAIEKFIMTNVESAGLSLEQFGLPTQFEYFKKITKTVNSKNDYRFKKLFQAFAKHELADIVLLSKWLKYLKTHNYDSELQVLKNM